MFASSILTLTIVSPNGLSDKAKGSPVVSSGFTDAELKKLSTTYDLIQQNFVTEVDKTKLIDGAVNGMLASLDDPYTTYMDQKEAEQFHDVINSTFQGIGAEVSLEDGRVKIVSPIKGSPAEKAGILANDVILSVNGEKLDGLNLTEAVSKIRGPKGSQAKLQIMRTGMEAIEVIVVRDDIPVETIYSEMLDGQVGKIEIREYVQHTAQKFKEALKKLEDQGMKGLIIDVRNNPGGLFPAVIDMSEPFIPSGKAIVQVEDRDGQKQSTVSKGTGKKYPVAVLINNGSASASEIMAGALQEMAGAKLIGENTYGKGTVQITFEKELGDGSNIKMTIMKWLTPNGTWIHKKGIAPDMLVEQPAFFKVAPITKKTVLKQDMTGEDVKNMQIMLEAIGQAPGRTDGYFNDKTTTAVKAFQRANSLPMTGEVDEKTALKLEEAVSKEIRDPKNDLQLKSAVQYLQGATAK
jgi:carboxyl-terminal processing protease